MLCQSKAGTHKAIATVGRLTTFVTFGILKFQGTATDHSLEGFIVGALVATRLLSSI